MTLVTKALTTLMRATLAIFPQYPHQPWGKMASVALTKALTTLMRATLAIFPQG